MHIRVVRLSRNGRTVEYPQLVESYRRDSDGMPAHRVIASLKDLSPVEIDNLRAALAAGRVGKKVVVAAARPPQDRPPRPVANLRYLDLAVLRALWDQWGLDDLFDTIAPSSEGVVPLSRLVCALTLQRCADPGSKLFASRWVPRTALPELLGFTPASFNNTRIHRALDAIEQCIPSLQAGLVERYQQREGAFATLFLDVTDTWFVGHGPSLAQRAKTKEGRLERKIGIVLLCNERGYPLRWEVVAGRTNDVQSMGSMLRSIAGLRWSERVPVVCDRAMGRTAQLREMLSAKLHFVTALTSTEFDAYVPERIPWAAVADVMPSAQAADDPALHDAAVAQARHQALRGGLTEVEDNLLILDAGVVTRLGSQTQPLPNEPVGHDDLAAGAMRCCRAIEEELAAGRYGSAAAAGAARGLSKSLTDKYRLLRALPDDVQCQILDGKAVGRTLVELLRIARINGPQAQRTAFAQLLATPAATPRRISRRASPPSTDAPEAPVRVRAVIYFNPQRFVDERLRARAQLAGTQQFVDQLNASLAAPRSRLQPPQILAAIDRRLRQDDLIETYRVQVDTQSVAGRTRHRVTLTLDEAQWQRRRRSDGFSVIAAHPDLPHSAAALCRLYRAKDAVEKDFQTIKSLLELRPVRHRNDAKVRAHVTLCMLALLLERTLDQSLGGLHSAAAALELLEPVRLNRYAADKATSSAYLITQTDEEQDAILRRLRLPHLALDEELLPRLTPR